mmetsp:Transcript_149372/g.260903  ORF Transcript_149372/g.260903 Transcript_149372/m.260903 type:complete len:133 (-) Transcript_149372:213-611(-)
MEEISSTIRMEVTIEGFRRTVDYLESTTSVTDKGYPKVSTKVSSFTSLLGNRSPLADRKMLDISSPNCEIMLCSLNPGCVKKCLHYRHDKLGSFYNVSNLLSMLTKKVCPPMWWRPVVLAKACNIGLYERPF